MQDEGEVAKSAGDGLRRWGVRLVLLVGGLLGGLGVAELIFDARDDGAFPHVNFYVADSELGARLEPGAEMRFQFRDNPVTEIRINADGYRGDDWGAPTDDEILVVGDSQVFGLGVQYGEAFSAQLAEALKRPVRNAGVPTYGPPEMQQVVQELLETRHPTVVIYTVNMVNDLFEAERPNRERHGIWDGWAVRTETMPSEVADFPGRRWFMSRSHLVYAARRWLAEGDVLPPAGFVSEGTFADLVETGEAVAGEHDEAGAAVETERADRATRLASIAEELEREEDRIGEAFWELGPGYDQQQRLLVSAAAAHPGDIVLEDYEESVRRINVTAAMIRRGARIRTRMIQRLRKAPVRRREGESLERARTALPARDRLVEERDTLRGQEFVEAHVPSVLTSRLEAVKALCDAAGAELVVLVLPLDVQVGDDEWDKYGLEHIDMEPSLVLNQDVVESARRMGVRALDVTEAIRASSTPRFLDHDIHMTPSSHAAVAQALVAALEEPAPVVLPAAGLAEGRTRLPTRDEWYQTREAVVRGSTAAGCETVVVREWLRVTCSPGRRSGLPGAVQVLAGGGTETLTTVAGANVTLVTTLLPGQPVTARFFWAGAVRDLRVTWPGGADAPEMAFEDVADVEGRELAPSEAEARLCACWTETMGERECETNRYGDVGECEASCRYAFGEASEGCLAAYGEDCASLVACATGDPDHPPRCSEGQVVAGGAGQCHALCNEARPCPEGSRCVPWQGSGICS